MIDPKDRSPIPLPSLISDLWIGPSFRAVRSHGRIRALRALGHALLLATRTLLTAYPPKSPSLVTTGPKEKHV
jgi:hypothetical protein